MNSKLAKIIGYLWWVGWLIAFLAGDKEDEGLKQHLNQALVLAIIATIPIGITQLFASIFMIWGIIKAIGNDDTPLPLVGGVKIIK